MANVKVGQPFGIDEKASNSIDWELSLKRIIHDLRSDFIYAPHLAFIYRNAGNELISQLKAELKAGAFNPGVPLTIEVPKSFRIRVAVPSKRLGPTFSRPGSILLPKDRLFYQALADQAAPVVNAKTDHTRSFSHRLAPPGASSMFLPTRVCWNDLQRALDKHAAVNSIRYVLKIDVANFFGSVNQHTLINVLNDSDYPNTLSSRLEVLLTSYTSERSSRGILQGLYPSDLFGNFYMMPIDRFLDDRGTRSARYVDDIYIFLESVGAGEQLLRELIPFLRTYDLVLNEAKCVLMPKAALITEEPDLEELFNDAVEEISSQIDDDDFDADYGFQSEWEDEHEFDENELELEATKVLFDSIEEYPGHEENIERFCLPLFAKSGSVHAVEHTMGAFKKRPSMSQIYSAYLARFLTEEDVKDFLLDMLGEEALTDWQRMWVLAALIQVKPDADEPVKAALSLLKDANKHDALRAVAAIYVGRYGEHTRRKALVSIYPNVSNYIQVAIYFSSRFWPNMERANAKASWGGHGPLHKLLTIACANK